MDRNTEDTLLMALASLIGTAITLKRKRIQDQQVILLKERSTIARELHDSLAQSLSYLKIQVYRLEKSLSQAAVSTDALAVTEVVKNGLNSAYMQLRELLKTFRLKLEADSLDVAIDEASLEFAEKGNFKVHVYNNLFDLSLTASEQIALLQIIREALSNCVRHADATQTIVNLWQEGDEVTLCVSDNGIGIVGDYNQQEHHGLLIMQERANNLGSKMSILNNTMLPEALTKSVFDQHNITRFFSGTTIVVSFMPQFFLAKSQ